MYFASTFSSYQGAGVEGVDIARNFLPDCVVFLTAVANLVTSAYIVAGIRKMNQTAGVVLQEQGQTFDVESEGEADIYTALAKFITV